MKKFIFFGLLVLLLSAAHDTFAQGRGKHRGNDDRADRDRIQRGVGAGQITRDEDHDIRERQRAIRAERRASRSDGDLVRDEREQVRRDERAKDHLIHRYRHNGTLRPNYNGRGWHGRHRRGNGYYRRGAGSPTHPVFGNRN